MSKRTGNTTVCFCRNFSVVGSFNAEIDYSEARALGRVDYAEDDHDGKVIHRVRREIPMGIQKKNFCFVHSINGHSFEASTIIMMGFGFMPATHHETVSALKQASPGEVNAFFDYVDFLPSGYVEILHITCVGTSVIGQNGELIPVKTLARRPRPGTNRLELRRLNLQSAVPVDHVLPFVLA
jgi:hypothetical protein